MKSVGEAMGIGRTFCEAMGKTLRSRELDGTARSEGDISIPKWDRLDALLGRMRAGESAASVSAESGIHPWFCDEFARTVALEHDAGTRGLAGFDHEGMRQLKRHGVSDLQIAGAHGLERGRRARAPARARRAARLQDRRLVRRRGRRRDVVPVLDATTASTSRSRRAGAAC